MSLGKRLAEFIEKTYKNPSVFADDMETSRSNIGRYIAETSKPDINHLKKMYELGISLHWLIFGTGSMFADNHNGRQLKKMFYLEDTLQPNITAIERIKFWIEANFNSVNTFAICTKYSINILNTIFEDTEVLDPQIINLMDKAGCNTEWILDGNGEMFNNNLMGCLLKKRSLKTENCKDDSILNLKFTTNEFMGAVLMLSKLHDINKNGILI